MEGDECSTRTITFFRVYTHTPTAKVAFAPGKFVQLSGIRLNPGVSNWNTNTLSISLYQFHLFSPKPIAILQAISCFTPSYKFCEKKRVQRTWILHLFLLCLHRDPGLQECSQVSDITGYKLTKACCATALLLTGKKFRNIHQYSSRHNFV